MADHTLTGHSDLVRSVTFSSDGKKVVSGSKDLTVRVWDIASGQVDQTLTGHSNVVNLVAFSPDGKKAVSGSYDSTVKVCIFYIFLSNSDALRLKWLCPKQNTPQLIISQVSYWSSKQLRWLGQI